MHDGAIRGFGDEAPQEPHLETVELHADHDEGPVSKP